MSKLIGTTRIELTDVHTGKKEVFEKHNMVTNALSDLFKPLGFGNDENIYFGNMLPYYEKLLGGILLFDKPLNEDPDDYFPPADAALIGCGVYNSTSDSDNLYRGSYNSVESEINTEERYVKFVYDYGTTQANGTIASVSLTHHDGGYTSYEVPEATVEESSYLTENLCTNRMLFVRNSSTGTAMTQDRGTAIRVNQEHIFLIDKNEDRVYYFKFTDAKHIHILKRRLYFKSVSIFDNNISTTKPVVEDIELDELAEEVSFAASNYNYDVDTGKLYIITSSSGRISPNGDFKILEIDCSDWNVKQYLMKNSSEFEISNRNNFMYVTGGFIYVQKYNSFSEYENRLYKIQLDNFANITEIGDSINSGASLIFTIKQRLFMQLNKDQVPYICNLQTNKLYRLGVAKYTDSSFTTFTSLRGNKLICYLSNGNSGAGKEGWVFYKNYLATINNLDVPVTKTAEKTMKITYILQEE